MAKMIVEGSEKALATIKQRFRSIGVTFTDVDGSEAQAESNEEKKLTKKQKEQLSKQKA